MGTLIYGSDRPKYGHEQSPDGSITIEIENENTYSFDRAPRTVAWLDLLDRTLPSLGGFTVTEEAKYPDMEKDMFHDLIEELAGLTDSNTEQEFFYYWAREWCADQEEVYSEYRRSKPAYPPLTYPALIPQVWVNWYHFDSTDRERAQLASKEPFRVDFAMKDPNIDNDNSQFTIIEIDGPTHFGKSYVGTNGEMRLETNMEAYTKHLKKDRWLRNKGWNVVRVSASEVDEVESKNQMWHFLNDITQRNVEDTFVPKDDLPFD